MNILILGATGYLGRYILSTFRERNLVFITLHHNQDINEKGIISVSSDSYRKLFEENQIDWIINCIGVYQRQKNNNILDGNLIYPLQVMDTAISYGVRNIININTALPEDFNFYTFTKRELGRFGKFYSTYNKINFYNLLVEMFYGKNEPVERFFPSIIRKMKNNDKVELTDGWQKRDIVHVEDVCQAVKLVMESELEGYFDIPVGTGDARSIREIVYYIYQKLDSKSDLLFGAIPMRENEPDSVADISLLTQLGYEVKYSWEKGLDDIL